MSPVAPKMTTSSGRFMVTLDPAGGVLWFDFELWSHCSSAKDMDVVEFWKTENDGDRYTAVFILVMT